MEGLSFPVYKCYIGLDGLEVLSQPEILYDC